MSLSQKQIAIRRFLAFGIDWLVFAVWAGILFGTVMILYSGNPPGPSGPWRSQAIGFLAMTLPIILYFTFSEASQWQASIGKRILSLGVVSKQSNRIPFSKILLRNVVKFTPWELGHLVANQAIFSSSSGMPGWVVIPMILSLSIPLWWIISIILSGVSPYDRITGIRITHTIP